MDRRTVTAVVLSLFIYYGWLVIRGGPPVDTDADPAMVATAVVDAPQVAPVVPVHTDIAVEQIPFESCGFEGVITNDGGGLRDITLPGSVGPYEVNPLYSWVLGLLTGGETNWKPYGDDPGPEILIGPNALALSAGSGDPAAPPTRFQVVSHGADGVVLQATDANGVNIRQVLSPAPRPEEGPCVFDVEVTWSSDGAAIAQPLWVGMHDEVETSTGMFSHYSNSERPWAYVEGDLEYASFNERLDDGSPGAPVPIEGEATWFGLADRYFGLLVLPSEPGEAVWSTRGTGEDAIDGVHFVAAPGLQAGGSYTAELKVFVGPLDVDQLTLVDASLTDIVDFGIFAALAYPLMALLRFFYGWLGNWGWAIVGLVLFVKVLFFPLSQAAFRSGEAMKAIQPQLNEIREKYKDDQQKQQQETMALFKEHKVNPLGGCLPMLIQMPVWFALYSVLLYSADLYHTEFLYLKDLSAPDPYCVLPVLVIVVMMLQQRFTPTGNMDPAQARMIKMMPLFFGIFWFMFPSGLVVYVFINTLVSILQQWWIRRSFRSSQPPALEAASP